MHLGLLVFCASCIFYAISHNLHKKRRMETVTECELNVADESPPLLKGLLLKGSSLLKGSAFRPWEPLLLNMAILDLTNESSWNTQSIQLVFALLLWLRGKYYHCNEYEEGIVQLHRPTGRVFISCAGPSDVSRHRKSEPFDRGPVCGVITLTRVKALWRTWVWCCVQPLDGRPSGSSFKWEQTCGLKHNKTKHSNHTSFTI